MIGNHIKSVCGDCGVFIPCKLTEHREGCYLNTPPELDQYRIKCPNCRKAATVEHLRESPVCMEAARSFVALYSLAKRKEWPPKGSTGRPRKLEYCQCGAMTQARAAQRNHKCIA